MKRAQLAAALLLLAGAAWADAPGSTSLDFLKLAGSARQEAMGLAGAALFDDLGSVDLNPAALGGLDSRVAQFSYDKLFSDAAYGRVGYGQPLPRGGNVSVDLEYLDYGAIAGYDNSGASQGGVKAYDRMAHLSWAAPREGIVPGASLKVAQESLDNAVATAVAADAGMIWRPPRDYESDGLLSHMTFGAAVLNAGRGPQFDDAVEKLPLTFSAGAAHKSLADALTLAADVQRVAGRGEPLTARLGAELWLKDVMAVRFGYRTDIDVGPGLSAGVGFRVNDMRVDYAFTPFGALGYAHRVGLALRFGGGLADRYYNEGVLAMREGRYPEAVILFDKALALQPRNPKVLQKALEAARALQEGAAPGPAEKPTSQRASSTAEQ